MNCTFPILSLLSRGIAVGYISSYAYRFLKLLILRRTKQENEKIEASAIQEETQGAVDLLHDLQSQLEAVSSLSLSLSVVYSLQTIYFHRR